MDLREALEPLLRQVGELSEKIAWMERKIEALAEERYPDCERLTAPGSVGRLTALCFMLVLGEAERFEKSRAVGAYVGLSPKKDQSGQVDKQCRISKAGWRTPEGQSNAPKKSNHRVRATAIRVLRSAARSNPSQRMQRPHNGHYNARG